MEKDFFPSRRDSVSEFTEGLDFQESAENRDFGPPPIPQGMTEKLPNPPNLENIPKAALQSGVIETLIAQNEDLMARLKVQIRRAYALESDVETLQEDRKKVEKLYTSARDQLAIWREKENKWKEKLSGIEEYSSKIESEFQWMEFRYSELDRTKSEREEQLQAHIQRLTLQKARLSRYVERVRKYIRPLIRNLVAHGESLNHQLHVRTQEIETFEQKMNELTSQVGHFEREVKLLEKGAQVERNRLTERHEQESLELRSEIQHYKGLCDKLTTKLKDYDQLAEKTSVLENQLIHSKRKRQAVEERLLIETEKLKNDQIAMSTQISDLTENKQEFEDQLGRSQLRNRQLEKQVATLSQQLNAMRTSWSEKELENQRLQDQVEQLEKINLEYSVRFGNSLGHKELEDLEFVEANF